MSTTESTTTMKKSDVRQSSHRILRWMEEGRPHSKDLHELFCVLITALDLKMHRVRLQKRYNSLTTYDALQKLGNLKFTHSNKRPSPEDPNIQLTTNLVTTYAMVPEMARLLCDAFLAARLWESCEGKTDFLSGDSVWQLTPKGINILTAFAQRNGVQDRHVHEVIDSPRNTLRLLVVERDEESDRVIHDRPTIELIFRRFAGLYAPNIKTSSSGSDSDSLTDLPNGMSGVKLSREKRIAGKPYYKTFTGKAALDWLMDCCTFVNETEAVQVAAKFVQYGYVEPIIEDRGSASRRGFSSSKNAIYKITRQGQVAVKWTEPTKEMKQATINDSNRRSNYSVKDSNKTRTMNILAKPALRMLFREFLRDTHCEENLNFYQEVTNFLNGWESKPKSEYTNTSSLRETLASSYDLYNSFLAPGSPCELNIDHTLRFAVLKRMTKSEVNEKDLLTRVKETVELYREAKNSIFKLMASDSVPKFLRDAKYTEYLQDYRVDEPESSPERLAQSLSQL